MVGERPGRGVVCLVAGVVYVLAEGLVEGRREREVVGKEEEEEKKNQ